MSWEKRAENSKFSQHSQRRQRSRWFLHELLTPPLHITPIALVNIVEAWITATGTKAVKIPEKKVRKRTFSNTRNLKIQTKTASAKSVFTTRSHHLSTKNIVSHWPQENGLRKIGVHAKEGTVNECRRQSRFEPFDQPEFQKK